MNHAHEQQEEETVELSEDALVMGKLMEVDWTKRTARLERFREKPIKLRFGKELDEEMRRFATEFVQIEGKGYFISPEIEKWAVIDVDSVSLPYDSSKPKKAFKGVEEWGVRMRTPEESAEISEMIKAIREAR